MPKLKKLKLLRKEKSLLATLNLNKKARLQAKLIQRKVKAKMNIPAANEVANFKNLKIKHWNFRAIQCPILKALPRLIGKQFKFIKILNLIN